MSSKKEIEPQRLELSLNPEDGSLLTAPLTQVLLAVTDGLYRDLHDMAQGEVQVAGVQGTDGDTVEEPTAAPQQSSTAAATTSQRMERLSNLSFAQRRHEIAWRLSQHSRGIQHVAALCAAAASSNLAQQVRVSSMALQHSRAAWVQADEAQDALYFFHAQLFPVRAAPHDVYGAADVLLQGTWFDLPTDLRILTDPYDISRPAEWTKRQVQEEWHMAIRQKLITGEVGWMKQRQKQEPRMSTPPWKVTIKGSWVHLTFGKPRQMQTSGTPAAAAAAGGNNQSTSQTTQDVYPLAAWLTVLPIPPPNAMENDSDEKATNNISSEWSLMALEVNVQAKTGEFNHQLTTLKRQRKKLVHLAKKAMAKEEQRVRQKQQQKEGSPTENGTTLNTNHIPPARPLHALFRLSHTFLLSWQLELLSAQAQALRRGIWAAGENNSLEVTPNRFFDGHSHPVGLLGVLSISFWKVDDQYGPPKLSDLVEYDEKGQRLSRQGSESSLDEFTPKKLRDYIPTKDKLVLVIRAEADKGIRVSISGGSALQAVDTPAHSRHAARNLIEATSNPLALSASDALLAATQLCAEHKCRATVKVLRDHLPEWINLSLERCGVVVGADMNYYGIDRATTKNDTSRALLFRLGCDARTGTFVSLFPRSMNLLRRLAGNEVQASEALAVRVASLPGNRRRAALADSSGRAVRGAFDGLIRSMNLLGQRVGVGREWDDIDERSASLRERHIKQACRDARQALITACGMAALYGIVPLAFGAAFGLNAVPDMAGGAVNSQVEHMSLLNAPPIGIILNRKMEEISSKPADSVSKKRRCIQQSLFAISCSASTDGVTLVPMKIETTQDSPGSAADRTNLKVIAFRKTQEGNPSTIESPPGKKPRLEDSSADDAGTLREVEALAAVLYSTRNTLVE